MIREEAIRILDEVIPPPEHHTVDLDHLPIAQAWLCIKEMLTDCGAKMDETQKKPCDDCQEFDCYGCEYAERKKDG